MLESGGNLNTSEIELRQQLPTLECEWLISCLRGIHGVADAKWGGNTRQLFVEYDADIFGSGELVDILHTCGAPVAALRAGYA